MRRQVLQPIKISDQDQRMHQSWCFKNKIRIYFVPNSNVLGHIVIERDGIPEHGAHKYKHGRARLYKKDEKWQDIIFKLYTQEYEKQNN